MCNYAQNGLKYRKNGNDGSRGDEGMVNEERLRPMVKMAMFDKNDGAECKPMIEYAREDYVALQLLGSFITGSIAFAILFGMWALCDIDKVLGMISADKIMEFMIGIGIWYVVFLIIYLIATYVVYHLRYSKGRKKVKKYYASLKKINNIYAREDKLKAAAQKDDDWE